MNATAARPVDIPDGVIVEVRGTPHRTVAGHLPAFEATSNLLLGFMATPVRTPAA